MNAMYIIMLSAFIAYSIGITIKYGLLDSYSQSYLKLKEDKKTWLFTLFMAIQAFGIFQLTCVPAFSISGMLMGLGLLIVAASPAYKTKNSDDITPITVSHYIGADISILASYWHLLDHDAYLLFFISLAIMLIISIFFIKKRFILLLVELNAFITIYIFLK